MRADVRLPVALIAAVAVGVLAAGYAVHRLTAPSPSGPGAVSAPGARPDFAFTVPAGTGARLDRGVKVAILPARIEARVGQVIRISNRDARGYLLGPFYVGAHETLTQRFTSTGSYTGECVVHPSGQLVLEVTS